MKKTLVSLLLGIAFFASNAQDMYENDQIRTLFSESHSNGGYGAFTVSYSNIGGYDAVVTGGRGAFIFDHALAIGLAGYGFVNNLDNYYHSDIENPALSLAGGYGGLLIEPIVSGKSPVHLSFPILIGGGGVSQVDMYSWEHWDSRFPDYEYGYDAYFVVEPGVELEFNVARFFRLAAGVSYRHTSKIQLKDVEPNALKGLNFGMTFKFGKF